MPADLRVLIVEDSEDDAELILLELRRGGYRPVYQRVASHAGMVEALNDRTWDLILSDFALPGFSGSGALELWKRSDLDIPFIVISGTIGEETAVMMMKAGASDYLMKQNLARLNAAIERELREAEGRRKKRDAEKFLRDSERRFSLFMDNFPGLVLIQNASGALVYVNELFKNTFPKAEWAGNNLGDLLPQEWKQLLLLGDVEALNGEVVRAVGVTGSGNWHEMVKFYIPREGIEPLIGVFALDVSERMRAEREVLEANRALKQAYDQTLEGWARALELHEKNTFGHSKRVVEWAGDLARELGIPDGEEMESFLRGALLHDIGKMGVPETILNKPGPLNADEWQVIRKHPENAYKLLSPIAYLRPAIDIPYRHHEHWDGTGYPDALAGDEIPFYARIFAVADVYCALCEKRSYSPAWPEPEAVSYIRSEAGKHFDPVVVEAFVRVCERKNKI